MTEVKWMVKRLRYVTYGIIFYNNSMRATKTYLENDGGPQRTLDRYISIYLILTTSFYHDYR